MSFIDDFVSSGISTLSGDKSSSAARSVNFAGTNIDIPVVYGEDIVPAIWVGFTQPTDDYYDFHGLAVFCHAPVEVIEWIEVNGHRTYPGVNWTNDHVLENYNSDHGYSYKAQKNGNTTRPLWIDDYDEWPPADAPSGNVRIGGGLVYAEFAFNVGKGFIGGIPTVRMKVKGRNCIFDPRVDSDQSPSIASYNNDFTTGQTETACTNPALIRADYLTNKHYGKGLSWDQIDIDQLASAAAICDTQVPDGDGGTIPLFEFSGLIDPNQKIDENLTLIDKHFRNHAPYHLGKFGFVIRDDSATPDLIPENWIVKHSPIDFGDKSKRYNQCIVTYLEPAWDLEENQVIYPPVGSSKEAAFLVADGDEVLSLDITLEGCRNRYQAIDQAEAAVLESRLQLSTKLTVKMAAFKYEEGDVVDVPLKGVGVTRMRIISKTRKGDCTIDWQLSEHSNDAYPWTTKTAIPIEAKDAVNPLTLELPNNIVFSSDSTNEHTSGQLSWGTQGNPLITGYRVTVDSTDTGRKHANIDVDGLLADIPNLPSGNYSITVRALTKLTNGPAAVLAIQIITPLIEAVTGLALSEGDSEFTAADCSFTWLAPTNAIFTVHEYRVQFLDINDDSILFESRTTNTYYTFKYAVNLKAGLFRQFKIKVYAQGKYGQDNVDTGAATLVVSNPLPVLPTGLSTSASQSKIQISFNKITDPDFKIIKFWKSTVSGFTPSAGNLIFETKNNQLNLDNLTPGTLYYARYSVLDVFHRDSDNGVLSSEFALQTAPDSENAAILGIATLLQTADEMAARAIIATDENISRKKETKIGAARILTIEVINENMAASLLQVSQDQASSGLLLQALKDNGSTQATAALYVDVDGALAGVFTSANETTSDMVFKADNFRFKTANGNKQPLSVVGDDVIINNAIIKSSINLNDQFIVDSQGNAVLNSASITGTIKSAGTHSVKNYARLWASNSTNVTVSTPNGTDDCILSLDTTDQIGVAGLVVQAKDTYGVYAYSYSGDALRGYSFINDGVNGTSEKNGRAGVRASNRYGPQIILGNNNDTSDSSNGCYATLPTFPTVTLGGILYTRQGSSNGFWFGHETGGTKYWGRVNFDLLKTAGATIV
jgi:hypothetical protein